MAREPTFVPKSPTETALHMASWRYLRHALPPQVRAWHVPNGGLRDPRVAGKLKAMGVVPGIPDFNFILPNAQAGFMELKVGKNSLTEEQEEFREWAVARGCAYAVCRSIDEVAATTDRWLGAYQLQPRASLIQVRNTLL